MAVTRSTWLLRGLHGSYEVYLAVLGVIYVALSGRLPCASCNSHLDSVIATRPHNYHEIATSHDYAKLILHGSYKTALHEGVIAALIYFLNLHLNTL